MKIKIIRILSETFFKAAYDSKIDLNKYSGKYPPMTEKKSPEKCILF